MAEEHTHTAPNDAAPATDDPVALIEDNIVRRLVRLAVHVRGYAPYYGATIAFGVMLLLVPGLGGGNAEDPDEIAAGVTRGTPDASASPSSSTRPSTPAAPAELAGADDFFTEAVTTEAPRTTSAPSFSFDDYDSDRGDDSPAADQPDDTQKPCYVEPPAGAPVSPVSPDREARNVQKTAEAAVGQEAPADASEPVRSAEEAAGQCDEDTGAQSTADVPSTPVPADAPAVDNDTVVQLVGNMFVY